jgi:hypothetical protein
MSVLPGMQNTFGAPVRFKSSPPGRADEVIEQQDMSVRDIFRTCHISRCMSVIGQLRTIFARSEYFAF